MTESQAMKVSICESIQGPDNEMRIRETDLDNKTKGILHNFGHRKIGDLKNLSRARFMVACGTKTIYINQLERFLGRPLSDASFETIEGEDFVERYQRLTLWYLEN